MEHDYLEFQQPLVRTFTVKAREGASEVTQWLDGYTLEFAYGWTRGIDNEQCWVPLLREYYCIYVLSGDLTEPTPHASHRSAP